VAREIIRNYGLSFTVRLWYYRDIQTERYHMKTLEQAIKQVMTPEQTQRYELTQRLNTRMKSKSELEKEAKANGLWDYRNNKIVEA